MSIEAKTVETTNILGQDIKVCVSWPTVGKDEAWPTKDITEQCETCFYFIPKSNSKVIRHALESDPLAPEDFYFGDNYLGICMLRASGATSKRSARNTPSILFPSLAKYHKCQSLGRFRLNSDPSPEDRT